MENSKPDEKVTGLLARHKTAIIGAVLFGILLAGPFALVAFNTSFAGVFPELVDDQNYYLARIQEVRDGFYASGNPYLAEYKSAPVVQTQTGEIASAWLLNIAGLPTPFGLILFPLLLGPVIFLLTYSIGVSLGASRFWALLGVMWLMGMNFTEFMRPLSPQFNFIFWLLSVWWLFRLETVSPWKWALVQAVFLGALFYLYPYYWTHIVVVLGLLFMWYLFFKVFKDKKTAVAIGGAGVGAFVCAIPYLLSLFAARALPVYEETAARIGFITTHTPSGLVTILTYGFSLAVIVYIAYKLKTAEKNLIIALALLAGGFIAMNQHVITGINMEFASHYGLQIRFAALFLWCASITAFAFWPMLLGKMIRAAVIIVLIVASASSILVAYLNALEKTALPAQAAEQAALLEWIQKNAGPEEIVYAPAEISSLIPGYTHANVFYERFANLSFMSDEEVIDRIIIQNYNAEINEEFVRAHERELFGVHYINAYNHAALRARALSFIGIESLVPERIPEARMQEVIVRAQEIQSQPLETFFAPYRVSYVLIPKGTSPDSQNTPVFSTAHFHVFKLTQ